MILGEKRERRGRRRKKNSIRTSSSLLHRHALPHLKVVTTPLSMPPRNPVFGNERKPHAPLECNDFLHMLIHVRHAPTKLPYPLISVHHICFSFNFCLLRLNCFTSNFYLIFTNRALIEYRIFLLILQDYHI